MKKSIFLLLAVLLAMLSATPTTLTVTQITDNGTGATFGSLSWAINNLTINTGATLTVMKLYNEGKIAMGQAFFVQAPQLVPICSRSTVSAPRQPTEPIASR
jgi:hypothetical protein